VIAKGINYVRKELPFILEDAENGLTHLETICKTPQVRCKSSLTKAI
jgi:hypothetical protein